MDLPRERRELIRPWTLTKEEDLRKRDAHKHEEIPGRVDQARKEYVRKEDTGRNWRQEGRSGAATAPAETIDVNMGGTRAAKRGRPTEEAKIMPLLPHGKQGKKTPVNSTRATADGKRSQWDIENKGEKR